jgi:hypothetical protein
MMNVDMSVLWAVVETCSLVGTAGNCGQTAFGMFTRIQTSAIGLETENEIP